VTVATTSRLEAVQAAAGQEGFDALVLVGPPHLAYVAGFHATPHERLIALVVPRHGPLRLVVPSLEEEAARAAAPDAELEVWRDETGPADALANALAGLADGARVGIEKSRLPVATYELAASLAPNASFGDADPLLRRLRIVKDEAELELFRRAGAAIDRAIEALAPGLRAGRTEAEVSAEAGRLAAEAGSEKIAFGPAVLTGPRSALPHAAAGAAVLQDGDLVIVDFGAVVGGYSSDITRTFVVGGQPDARQQELFDVVRAAQRAALDAVRPGVPCAEIDRTARAVIRDAGLGEYFVHRTGHGLGLEIHEPPYLDGGNEEPLGAGMVITVEPGVYVPGYGGVRIEDDAVVTADGVELLTRAPVSLAAAS
jgi:Xaa-Pro dipeptidase